MKLADLTKRVFEKASASFRLRPFVRAFIAHTQHRRDARLTVTSAPTTKPWLTLGDGGFPARRLVKMFTFLRRRGYRRRTGAATRLTDHREDNAALLARVLKSWKASLSKKVPSFPWGIPRQSTVYDRETGESSLWPHTGELRGRFRQPAVKDVQLYCAVIVKKSTPKRVEKWALTGSIAHY